MAQSNHRTTLPQSRPCGRASSLREGAGKRCVPFIGVLANVRGFGRFSSPLRNSEMGTFHHSSCYTPSASLRMAVPFNVPPGNWKVAGDFHRPYGTQRWVHFTIQRGTLPQAALAGCRLPQRGSREWLYHSTCRSGIGRLRAIFIAPTKTQGIFTFYHSTGGIPSGREPGWVQTWGPWRRTSVSTGHQSKGYSEKGFMFRGW